MKVVCLIPARYDSTRYPGKLMEKINDIPVILFTYHQVRGMGLFDEVLVVTNSKEIQKVIEKGNGKVKYLSSEHPSGTDRIAEAAKDMDVDIVINIQGDEPFVTREPINDLIKLMQGSKSMDLLVTSLMRKMDNLDYVKSPNFVKVVCDEQGNALYFSRSVIPFSRNIELQNDYYEHIGVYGYTKAALLNFYKTQATHLEKLESVECLRLLEKSIPIKMVKATDHILEIDTPEDRNLAESLVKSGKMKLYFDMEQVRSLISAKF